MTNHSHSMHLRVSVLAVRAALAAMLLAGAGARAAEPTVAELTTPASSVELGVLYVSDRDAKAQEYNGVRDKGTTLVGNVDLRGSGPYDGDSAFRWRVQGRNIGLNSGSLGVQLGVQGQYRIDLSYDELRRNRSDSYQTPYLGAGTNVLTLPGTWRVPLVPRLSVVAPAAGAAGGANARGLSGDVTASSALIAGVLTAPTAAQATTAAGIQAADLPLFHSVLLSTERRQYGVGLAYELSRQWQFTANVTQEHKTGLKPMGTVTRYTNADMSAIIPDLIDQDTQQFTLGLNFVGEKLNVATTYHGSLFTNNVTGMTWANWAVPGNSQTMGSAPSNQFHQFAVTGTYAFTPSTRFTANASYGRATQNQAFLTDTSTPLVPVASLHGLVVSQAVNLKLTSRPMKNLSLAAAYKFDDRDNRTPLNTYAYYDAGELKAGTSVFAGTFPGLGSNSNINANRPYSKRSHLASLDADWAFLPGQALKAGAEFQKIDRGCSGSWIACVDADQTRESTLRAEWRLNPLADFNARLSASTARRTVDYNENAFLALVPAANLVPTGAPGGASAYATLVALGLTGYGPVQGLNPLPTAGSAQAFYFASNNALSNALYGNANRISELPGMRRFNLANRNRDKLRAAVNWQATETISLQGGLDYNDDRYNKSVYGLTGARSWALNVDGTWAPTDDLSLTLYATTEDQRSKSAGNTYTANSPTAAVNGFTAISGGCFATIALRNASNKTDPCLNWTADMRDKVDTLGLSATRKRLLGGALDLRWPELQPGALRHRHDRRQLREQPAGRGRRTRRHGGRVLHPGHRAAHGEDPDHRTQAQRPLHADRPVGAAHRLHLAAHEVERLGLRRHAGRRAVGRAADQRESVQLQRAHGGPGLHLQLPLSLGGPAPPQGRS